MSVVQRALALLLAVPGVVLASGGLASPGGGPGTELARGARGQDQDGPELDAWVSALGQDDPDAFRSAWEGLLARGPAAAERALEDWDTCGPAARVARARLLAELAPEVAPDADRAATFVARLGSLVQPAASPEAGARLALVEALGSPALSRAGVDVLARSASDDPDPGVRVAALQALVDGAEPRAADALDALLPILSDEERPRAARALAQLPAARARVVRRVQEALSETDGTDLALRALRHHGTLAGLARGYGRALAELPDGGARRRDRMPFLVLRRHPARSVRASGSQALEGYLQRLVELKEEDRADAALAALAVEGMSPREVLYRRARLALAGRGRADEALAHAEALVRSSSGAAAPHERGWLHLGQVLRGAALFAGGDAAAAREAFLVARGVLESLIAEREDLRPSLSAPEDHPLAPVGGALVVDRLVDLGLLEVWLALCALSEGRPLESEDVLRPLRRAHVHVLEAQLLGLETDAELDARSLDDFLDRDLGPRRLLLVSRALPGGEEGRFLDLQLQLGRALASVVPQEVMGFERVPVADPALGDVLLDDERFGLLRAIGFAERDAATRAWFARSAELRARSEREDDPAYRGPAVVRQDPEWQRLRGLQIREQDAVEVRQRATPVERADPALRERLYPELRELRTPSLFALTLAGELRADGRSSESRALATGMLNDLRGSSGQSVLWQEWISARLELAVASAWMDEDESARAEEAGLAAVRRLEALERSMDELVDRAGDDAGRAAGLRRQKRQTELLRADALLSLAVNANVRGKDPERALGFFERAFELDQREFMRVLLACYRARSGREEEARAVLRGVQPAPSLYYNLACTHALLGEPDAALDYLRRELEENQPTPGALTRQKAWAREDPDLAALHDDPRFLRLTEPEDESRRER